MPSLLKIEALAKFLKINPEMIKHSQFPDNFRYGSNEYLVYTEIEANNACADFIKETIFLFNSEFILFETGLNYNNKIVETFKTMQERQQSNCRDFLLSLIDRTCGFDAFVDSVILKLGRGTLLATLDGKENQEGNFFIYRIEKSFSSNFDNLKNILVNKE